MNKKLMKNITYREILKSASITFGEWDLSELDLNTSVLNAIMYKNYPPALFEPVKHEDGMFEVKKGVRVYKNKETLMVQMYVLLDINNIKFKVGEIEKGIYFKELTKKYLKHNKVYYTKYDPKKKEYASMIGIIRLINNELVISTYGTMYTETDHGGVPILVDILRTSWVDGILNYNLYIQDHLKRMLTKRMYKELKKK